MHLGKKRLKLSRRQVAFAVSIYDIFTKLAESSKFTAELSEFFIKLPAAFNMSIKLGASNASMKLSEPMNVYRKLPEPSEVY